MKQFLALYFLFFCLVTFGQKTIVNKLTDQYKPVLGTKVSMILPAGFIDAANFLGFQQTETGSTIMVVGMSGIPYSTISTGITKENLSAQGIEVTEIEQLKLNGLPAIFVTAKQLVLGDVYSKYILCFGTEVETIIINGVYPPNSKLLEKEIKIALLSTVYDAGKAVNELEVIDFELDVSKSKLLFAKTMSNQMLFTKDGQAPTKSEDKTLLIAGKSISKTAIEDKKTFCIARLEELPISLVSKDSINEITIDGMSGYEIYATTKNKITGATEKVYQVILFKDASYYIFYGSASQDFDENILDMKEVVRSFKRK